MLVTGENPSHFKNLKHPVVQVSWKDCRKFIDRLNQMVPDGGFRLPTEAEWEYACRAGTTTRYSFGDDEGRLARYAWYDRNSGNNPHEVGTKEANPWGLYDMHGNVWEWCQDWIGTYQFPAGGVVENPVGPGSGQYRVLRGGSWHKFRYDGYCRSASRVRGSPDGRHFADGFRLAMTLK